MRTRSIAIVCCTFALLTASDAPGQPAAPGPGTTFGADERIADLTLVRIGDRHAAVRFGSGPLLLVSVGDRLGRTRAEVKEIDGARLVLAERATPPGGRPTVARIVLREGERGGTRYLARPDEEPVPAVRPLVRPVPRAVEGPTRSTAKPPARNPR